MLFSRGYRQRERGINPVRSCTCIENTADLDLDAQLISWPRLYSNRPATTRLGTEFEDNVLFRSFSCHLQVIFICFVPRTGMRSIAMDMNFHASKAKSYHIRPWGICNIKVPSSTLQNFALAVQILTARKK